MDSTEFKKRKRGKRGGKSDKQAPVNEQEADAPEAVVNEIVETETNTKKKTRRSKRGKTIDEFPVVEQPETHIEWTEAGPQSNLNTGFGFEELDSETRQYFKEMEDILETKEFETPDEKYMFISNAFNEVNGKELIIASDFEGSRILEKLLKSASDFQIRVFADRLTGNYEGLFKHQFASHVCQTLLMLAADVIERDLQGRSINPDVDDEQLKSLPSMEDIIKSITEEIGSQWGVLMTHSHGSYMVRTFLNVLAGESLVEETQIRSKKSSAYNKNHNNTWETKRGKKNRLVPSSFAQILSDIVSVVSNGLTVDDFKVLALHPVANPVLQLLVAIPGTGKGLVGVLLSGTNAEEFIKKLIENQVGSHLMEKIILYASAEQYKVLYKSFFRSKLLNLCNHNVGNFVVQKVIECVHKEKQLKEIVEELQDHFEHLLFGKFNRTGVIVKILESATKYPKLQKLCVDTLHKVFHSTEAERKSEFINLVLYKKNYEKFQEKIFVHQPDTQGSLIIQHLLHFTIENIKFLVDSILKLPDTTLLLWVKDPMASRILETLLSSETVPKKSKIELIQHFMGGFAKFAEDKFTSRFVDKCWVAASYEQKEQIAQELVDKYTSLSNSFVGKFVLRNCQIDLFRKRKDEWSAFQKKSNKKSTSKQPEDKPTNEIDEFFSKKNK
ncbi:armadillo-type protein [Globomyces pollinis-pini]|nr:armadillo-type protein [Globomyces pollinis-pini]